MRDSTEIWMLFGWSRYEASAYNFLARTHPMSAKELSVKAGIPDSKIYGAMASLEEKGYVKVIGNSRKKIYDAQNPRYVLEHELKKFQGAARNKIKHLEALWEIREEKTFSESENSWVVKGAPGIAIELKQMLKKAKRNIKIIDETMSWPTKKDLNMLRDLVRSGRVKINAMSANTDILNQLADFGCNVKILQEPEHNWYIIDDSSVLLITGSKSPTGTVLHNKTTAKVLAKEYDELFSKAKAMEMKK
ncbi:MAG: helix-turn-helix domain-containing protein [Candidatus Thermoplasmatota archaeon]